MLEDTQLVEDFTLLAVADIHTSLIKSDKIYKLKFLHMRHAKKPLKNWINEINIKIKTFEAKNILLLLLSLLLSKAL